MSQHEASDGRVVLPSASRNRDPILRVLSRVFPAVGTVLEVASGTGQHAWYFAKHRPRLVWQPTDLDEGQFASIEAWRRHEPLDNLLEPLRLDVTSADWPIQVVNGISAPIWRTSRRGR